MRKLKDNFIPTQKVLGSVSKRPLLTSFFVWVSVSNGLIMVSVCVDRTPSPSEETMMKWLCSANCVLME